MKRYSLLVLLTAFVSLLCGAELPPPAGYTRPSAAQSGGIIMADDFANGMKNWQMRGPRTFYFDKTGGSNGNAGIFYDRIEKNARRDSTLVKRFKLTPGKSYRAKVNYKIDNIHWGAPQDRHKMVRVHPMYVDILNGKKYLAGKYPRYYITPNKPGEWRECVAEFTVPQHATHTNISLGLSPQGYKLGVIGKISFDDFQLEQLGDTPAQIYPVWPSQLAIGPDGDMEFYVYDFLRRNAKILKLRVVYGKKDIMLPVENNRVKFNVGKLARGIHNFKLQLLDTERKIIAGEAEYDFTVNAPEDGNFPGSTKLGRDGIIYVNGKPFFPVQMAVSPRKLDKKTIHRMKEAGINLIFPYSSLSLNVENLPGPPSLERIRKSLDYIHSQDMKVLLCVYEQIKAPLKVFEGITDPFKMVEYAVKELHRHPAILGWYIADENPLSQINEITRLRKVISKADPYHPVVVCTDKVTDHPFYGQATDIMEPDCYPIKGKESNSMSAIRNGMETAVGLSKWFFAQAFHWGAYIKPETSYRNPTAEEMRSMAFLSINLGAKCVAFYGYGAIWGGMTKIMPQQEVERFWKDVTHAVQAAAEAGRLAVSGEKAFDVKIENKAKNVIGAKAYKGGKKVCVVITGDGPGKADALIKVPTGIDLKSKYGRTVKVSDGVYRFTGNNICSDLLVNY